MFGRKINIDITSAKPIMKGNLERLAINAPIQGTAADIIKKAMITLDEKLKNNLGLKFAFRSTDINEIKKTLAFFGVDPEDENNQKRLRDLENGQCLISDLYGRVGVIQFHPVFEELLHAFDTRPPVRKEV